MTAIPLSVNRPVITHTAALRAIGAALAHAESLQISVAAAVVNSGGTLTGFARMPNAFLISGDLSIGKAHSVAAVGLPAEVVEQAMAQEAPRVREGIALSGFSFIRGGLPIHEGDALIGAIGVSGGSEAQDVACAQAGVAALRVSSET